MPRAKYLPKHWHDEDELHTDIRCLIKRMMTHAKECHRTVVYFANLITVLLVYEVEHELLIFLNQTHKHLQAITYQNMTGMHVNLQFTAHLSKHIKISGRPA